MQCSTVVDRPEAYLGFVKLSSSVVIYNKLATNKQKRQPSS